VFSKIDEIVRQKLVPPGHTMDQHFSTEFLAKKKKNTLMLSPTVRIPQIWPLMTHFSTQEEEIW